MTGKRTMVAYVTKGGVTRENADIIAGVLRDGFAHQVEVVDMRAQKVPDIAPYDNVVVGAGIRIGRYYGKVKKVLRDKRLAEKRVAIFLSSGEAGKDPDAATEKYVGRMLGKFPHVKPVSARAFGGRMPKNPEFDYTDPEKVREWAHELGERLENAD